MVRGADRLGVSRAEIKRMIAADPKVARQLEESANEVRDYWKSIAPVFGDRPPHRKSPPFGDPGDYRDSIHVEMKKNADGLIARVVADDFKAVWIEFGSRHMPEYAPAQKTIRFFKGKGSPRVTAGGALANRKIMAVQRNLHKELARLGRVKRASTIADAQAKVEAARAARHAEFEARRKGFRDRRRGSRRRRR